MSDTPPPSPSALPDHATWRARAERDLRGAAFERKLVHQLLGGVTVQPLYTRDDAPAAAGAPGAAPFVRGSTTSPGWAIGAVVVEPDPRALSARLTELQELSADVARVRLDRTGVAGTLFGRVEQLAAALREAPGGLQLDLVGPELTMAEWAVLARALPQAALGVDPVGARAVNGGEGDLSVAYDTAAAMVLEGSASRARISTAAVSEAGGSGVLQLAWALACGARWLRALVGAGASVSAASARVQLDLALGTDLFVEIARTRAARLAWARLTEACGHACGLRIHAVQARRPLSRRDPWTNLLRGVTAATAGVLGGATAVSLWPMDARLGAPGALSRRLAVTTQLLLRDESHLDQVLDPLGGSWAVERLTRDLAERAWVLFQEIEGNGGAEGVLASGWLLRRVDADHAAQDARVRTRRRTLVGVSDFATPGETSPGTRAVDLDALRDELALAEPTQFPPVGSPPLPFRPAADPFEQLWRRAEAARAAGRPASVELRTLGPLAERAARTTWVTNALLAGGLEVHEVAATADLGARVVVLCGSDARYARSGPLLASLQDAGALVVVAGRSAAMPHGATAAHHLHVGADLVAVLSAILNALDGEDQ